MVGTTSIDRDRVALDRERLRFERQKLAVEIREKRRQRIFVKKSFFKDLMANPVALAIVGGFVTLMTGIDTSTYTAS